MLNLLNLRLAAALALVPAVSVLAIDGDIQATANFRQALTVAQIQPLNYNATGPDIEFTGAPDTSVLRVFTDSSYFRTGTFFLAPTGTATAGILEFTGTAAETVNIRCDDTARLEATTGEHIILSDLEINMNAGIAVNATDCAAAGLAGAPVIDPHTIGGTGIEQIFIGGRIVANSGDGVQGLEYSTANGTGNPITIRVLYN